MFCISCGFSVICCNKLCIPGVLNILAGSFFKKKTFYQGKDKQKKVLKHNNFAILDKHTY